MSILLTKLVLNAKQEILLKFLTMKIKDEDINSLEFNSHSHYDLGKNSHSFKSKMIHQRCLQRSLTFCNF